MNENPLKSGVSEDSFVRQRDWYNPDTDPNPHISVVGCGGIGSITIEGLVRLGIKQLSIADPDKVELHNVANQMFYMSELDKPKASILAERLSSFKRDNKIEFLEDYFQNDPSGKLITDGIVISATDNMLSRKLLFEKCQLFPVQYFIDGRLAGQAFDIYVVDMSDLIQVKAYTETLYSDDEATPTSCTASGVADLMFMVGGLMVQTVRNILTSHTVAFKTLYDHYNRQFMHFNEKGQEIDITEEIEETDDVS